jgi:hypothetical protein
MRVLTLDTSWVIFFSSTSWECKLAPSVMRGTEKGQYTDRKENKIFLIYREIQMGSGAKSYMRKGFLIYEEMHNYFPHI